MSLRENLRQLEMLRRMLGAGGQNIPFGQEVRLARTRRHMTLDAVSKATGMAKSYLSQIETGYAPPPRDDKVRRLAEALGLDPDALAAKAHLSQMPPEVQARLSRLGEVFDSTEDVLRALVAAREAAGGDADAPSRSRLGQDDDAAAGAENADAPSRSRLGQDDVAHGDGNTPDVARGAGIDLDALHSSGLLRQLAEWGDARAEERRAHLRPIPVINKVSAGYPQDFTDLGYPVGIADSYVSAPAELTDPSAFAVRVCGDSMEPRYHEGDVVIFSPAASVGAGDDCFVRFSMDGVRHAGESTFKRVFFDSEESVRLQPLNERYAPTLVAPADIAAIFRAVARYERL
jgi:phage repressor protein C with HTH and peptisase S24 domain/transcriptional regulator with XRE-family HTH domain